MRCRTRIPVLTFVLMALVGCANPPPPEFVSESAKFRVRFGGVPKEINQPTGDIPSQIFTVESATGAYTVRVFELQPFTIEEIERGSDTLLNDAKSQLLHSVDGAEIESKTITLAGKYPGRELMAKATRSKPGLLRARIYLAGKRLYKVSVFGTEDFANSPAATAFLDSFMVIE